MVNDVGSTIDGAGATVTAAERVVEEITAAGGSAGRQHG